MGNRIMEALYKCDDCHCVGCEKEVVHKCKKADAVVKVHGSFTCMECWNRKEANYPPVLIKEI